jgi:hypothetical protein
MTDINAMRGMMSSMQAEAMEMQKLQMWHNSQMEKISGVAQANKGGNQKKDQIIQNFK